MPEPENTNENDSPENENTDVDKSDNNDAPEVIALREQLTAAQEEVKKLKKRKRASSKKAEGGEGDEETDVVRKELDATQAELAKLRTTLRAAKAEAVAAKANAVDPEVVTKLINFDELDDPDSEEELNDVILDILERKPYLKKRPRANAGERDRSEKPVDMNHAIRFAAGRQ